jgi:hypothetical protein
LGTLLKTYGRSILSGEGTGLGENVVCFLKVGYEVNITG